MKRSALPQVRFRLRTLFGAMTIAAVVLAARFGWKPDWIAARRAYLEQNAAQMGSFRPSPAMLRRFYRAVSPTAGLGARFTLWFHGEPRQSYVVVPIRFRLSSRMEPSIDWLKRDETMAAARLFPEATIYPCPIPEPFPIAPPPPPFVDQAVEQFHVYWSANPAELLR